jgi:hypothetical protein
LKGELRVDTDDEQYDLKPAQIMQLNPMMAHSLTAKEETVVFQVTYDS